MKTNHEFLVGDVVLYRDSVKDYQIISIKDGRAKFKGYEDVGFFDLKFFEPKVKPVPVVQGVDFTRPVTTRDGRPVRILCTDLNAYHKVVGIVTEPCGTQYPTTWTLEGSWQNSLGNKMDLINPPVKKYINLFKDDVSRMYYDTREEAEKAGNSSKLAGYVKTIEVEI